MNKSQIDRLIGAMGKLSLANGMPDPMDALLAIEEARALCGSVALELEQEIALLRCPHDMPATGFACPLCALKKGT
jgi:hypothetical protein